MKFFNTTKSNLYLLIIIFLLAFISFFSINKFFIHLVKDLDNKSKNYQSKIQIGQFISNDIKNIESLFLRLYVTSSSKISRNYIKSKIYKQVDIINSSLDILENGGILKRIINLNIQGIDKTTKIIKYNKLENDFSLESIDIKPKLSKLKNMIYQVETILDKRDIIIINKNNKELIKVHKKITRYYKSTPAFFLRMNENIARLLYEGEKELSIINSITKKKKEFYNNIRLIILFSVVLFVLTLGFTISKRIQKDNNKLKETKLYIRTILDSQTSLVCVSENSKLIDTNNALLTFLGFESFTELTNKHSCICEFFIKNEEDELYVYDKDYNGNNWIEHVINNNYQNKVLIKKDNKYHHFSISIASNFYEDYNMTQHIITLNNITSEIIINNTLEELVKDKTKELQSLNNNLEDKIKEEVFKNNDIQKQLFKSEKLAAMGEMIANIAHQWRQPLSVISVLATGIKVRHEMEMITPKFLDESCDNINTNAQYLSKTIDDFKNFLKGDREKIDFNLLNQVNSFINIIKSSSSQNNINIIVNINKNINIFGFENELTQCIINIYNNSKDAYLENNIKNKLFIIESKEESSNVLITFKDNAKGIPSIVLPKIFEPYFTTKHQSQGTGLGLNMTYKLITQSMNGTIEASNTNYIYENINYEGAMFTITLPKKSLK